MNAATTTDPYRPAVRGLIFGVVALGFRGGEMLALKLTSTRDPGDESDSLTAIHALEEALEFGLYALPWLNVLATLIALAGVGYSAIAAHRRDWGVVLVLAWITSVIAALFDIELFVYTEF